MSPHVLYPRGTASSFPRVSGDEPAPAASWQQLTAFSPRERG